MREILYNLLTSDFVLQEITGDRWVASTGLDGEGDQAAGLARPFGTFRISGDYPGVGRVFTRTLELWVHDEPGNYDNIDRVIRRLKALLNEAVQIYNPETDSWLQEASWTSTSPDLYDDIRRTNTRMASFNLVGSGD